jgi:ATP-binding cassette, subfamily B, bacterial PglK
MFNKLKNFIRILERKDQIKLIGLFFMMLISVVIEVFSIASILPLTREFFNPGESLQFLNNIKSISSFETIYVLILFFLLIYFIKFIFLLSFTYHQNKFISNLSAKLTTQLFNTYLFREYEFHTQNNSSTMLRNLVTEVKLLCSSFIYPIFTLIIETAVVLGILIFLFNYHTIISFITAIFFITVIGVYFISIRKKFLHWGNQRQDLNRLTLKYSLHGLNAIKEIKIYNKENYFKDVFSSNEFKFAELSKVYQTFQQLPRLLFEFIIVLFLISLMFFLKFTNEPNNEIFEILGVFSLASMRFIPSASRIIGSLQLFRFASPTIDLILKENLLTKNLTDKIIKDKTNIGDHSFSSSINLKNLSFKFENKNEFILKNINLEIKKNEIIGIYGVSGSGKSTIVDLISGLLSSTSGRITMDNEAIKKNIFSWRAKFGYVTQNTYLLDDTIKNNIVFGDSSNFDDSRFKNAIDLSQLSKFVNELPDNVETIVGERGVMLSGGQIQRIGIARAIYHQSDILIFDESTSALDLTTEQKIMDEIINLKNKKTIIIISHKISILKICDKTYELKDKNLKLKI